MRKPRVPGGLRYQPGDAAFYGVPWAFPRILWALPWWPVRLYLHVGDRLLFFAWYHSRGAVWWLEDRMGATGSYSTEADR